MAELYCAKNNLTAINIKENTGLRILDIENNKIKTLETLPNTMLMGIACSNNAIETLNLSANVRLKELYCRNNKLTNLDLTKNTKLKMLQLDHNLLGDISWTTLNKLYSLSIVGNKFSGELLTRLLDSLPEAPEVSPEEQDSLKWGVVDISENPGTLNANTIKATENGWKVIANSTTKINEIQNAVNNYLYYNSAETTIYKSAFVAKIVLYSTDGRCVEQYKNIQERVSLHNIPSGHYIVVAYNQSGKQLASIHIVR